MQNSFNNQQSGSFSQYSSSSLNTAPVVEKVLLPTQVIEKPAAIHEEIRKELVEEIQPVVNVEKIHTEIRQVTQPLFDKEVRSVQIENRTLATEVLPEVLVQGRGTRAIDDISTTRFLDSQTVIVEKPALYNEVERKQIIEEVQPVIYKETIVPTVIQETKPIYQKVVEGPVYTQNTLPAKEVAVRSQIAEAYVPSNVVIAPIKESLMLPTQIVEKPTAVHEEIRRETIEEITPVWNVEKLKTEVHQITAPLYDKEIRPVMYEKKVLNTEILPEVLVEGRGVRAMEDMSTTRFLDTRSTLIEKPAIFNEIERTQIIEEIQPVVYKETVVPTVIRETKPVFQKIVEGPVYTQQTLAPRNLSETNYQYPTSQGPILFPDNVPVITRSVQPTQPIQEVVILEKDNQGDIVEEIDILMPAQQSAQQPLQPHGVKEVVEEVITTTTTTTTAPVVGVAQGRRASGSQTSGNQTSGRQHGGLFHRHGSKGNVNQGSSLQNNTFSQTTSTHTTQTTGLGNSGLLNSGLQQQNLPLGTQQFHNERAGPNGQKIVEDTTTTHSHTEQVLPARLI